MPRWGANVGCASSRIAAALEKSLAPLQGGPMVKRIAPIRVICFCLLAACGALCQKPADLIRELQFDGWSGSPPGQDEEMPTSGPLPDAPSGQHSTQAKEFRTFFEEAHLPFTLTEVGGNARVIRATELDHVKAATQLSYTGR